MARVRVRFGDSNSCYEILGEVSCQEKDGYWMVDGGAVGINGHPLPMSLQPAQGGCGPGAPFWCESSAWLCTSPLQ